MVTRDDTSLFFFCRGITCDDTHIYQVFCLWLVVVVVFFFDLDVIRGWVMDMEGIEST